MDIWDKIVRQTEYLDVYGEQNKGVGMRPAQIAFEYDASWLENLTSIHEDDPPYPYRPCNPFVYYAEDWAINREPGRLWLIDRKIKRDSDSKRPPARFFDATHSYHKIMPHEVSSDRSAFTSLETVNVCVNHFQSDPEGGPPPRYQELWVLECCEL